MEIFGFIITRKKVMVSCPACGAKVDSTAIERRDKTVIINTVREGLKERKVEVKRQLDEQQINNILNMVR
jgi:Zn ribbon nucleic-acid-binding protein